MTEEKNINETTHGLSVHDATTPFSAFPRKMFHLNGTDKFLLSSVVSTNFYLKTLRFDLIFKIKPYEYGGHAFHEM